jgi:hypothetical protein
VGASGCSFLRSDSEESSIVETEDAGPGEDADQDDPDQSDAEPPASAGRGVDDPPPPPPPPPDELPAELCDGADNDNNGQADDADMEDDGVCDCLRVATIGLAGNASSSMPVFRSWPNQRAQNPVVALENRKLTDALLAPYQVLIVLDVAPFESLSNNVAVPAHHTFDAQEVAALERWVRAGGGLLTTSGYRHDEAREVTNVNRLLQPFGMAYSTTNFDADGYVQNWTAHALTEGVSNVFVSNGVTLNGATALSLARDSGNRVVFQASMDASARVLAWGDEWITFEDQWQDREDQQVEQLWLNMLTWLSPAGNCQRHVD